uniref:Uncharacterized protein n=1 Tax=Solanum tuberosum TaxID=4113 RepID=M1DEG0_SOLTU
MDPHVNCPIAKKMAKEFFTKGLHGQWSPPRLVNPHVDCIPCPQTAKALSTMAFKANEALHAPCFHDLPFALLAFDAHGECNKFTVVRLLEREAQNQGSKLSILHSGLPGFLLQRVKYGIYPLYPAQENGFDEDKGMGIFRLVLKFERIQHRKGWHRGSLCHDPSLGPRRDMANEEPEGTPNKPLKLVITLHRSRKYIQH